MNPELVAAAAAAPVSLSETKAYLRVEHADYDTLIQSHIDSAVAEFENLSGRALVSSTWDYILEEFPFGEDCIDLPKGQVSSVTSVKYYLEAGTEQTFSATEYEVDVSEGSIELKRYSYWPTDILRVSRQIVIRFVAGWANAAAVPADIKTALKVRVQQMFDGPSTVGMGNTQLELSALQRIWDSAIERWKLYE